MNRQRTPIAHVTGVDISRRTVEYAQTQVETQGLSNAHFQVMNALQPLEFPEQSFDLVHARFISGFMSTAAWLSLLGECRRVLRPGGIICLTEGEWGGTTSQAIEEITHALTRALYRAGYGFAPNGYHAGVSFMLRRLLQDAHYDTIESQAHCLDYSSGTEAHSPFYQNLLVAFQLPQPFLLKANVLTAEEVDRLYEQLPVEMLADDFCGMSFFLTVWGEKAKDHAP